MHDPDDMLGELCDAVSSGRPASVQVRTWWSGAVRAAVQSGERLDTCLGLSRPGSRTLQSRVLKIERDRHIVAALRAVAVGLGGSDWERCCRLAPLARSFITDAWPRVRSLSAPVESWEAWRRHVFLAAATGLDVPTSPTALREVLLQARACSQETRPATVLTELLRDRNE